MQVRMPNARSIALLTVLLASACSGAAEAPKDGKPAAEAAADNTAKADTNGPALTGPPVAVDGVASWTENRDGGFKVDIPGGGDWTAEKTGPLTVHSDKLDVTILLQHQSGIEPDQLGEFIDLVRDSNKRDAPKYSDQPPAKGSLAGHPAARIDGEFDNGTAYVTRDYLVISPKGASSVMTRGPKTDAARVQAIADHVAATFAAQ